MDDTRWGWELRREHIVCGISLAINPEVLIQSSPVITRVCLVVTSPVLITTCHDNPSHRGEDHRSFVG